MRLATKVNGRGDGALRDQILASIHRRYGAELYQPAGSESEGQVEVRVTKSDDNAQLVFDAPRHQLLHAQLVHEFGEPRCKAELLLIDKLTQSDDLVLRYRINRVAQIRLFEAFRTEVADFLGSLFPILSVDGKLKVQCREVRLEAPTIVKSSRWTISAELGLLDIARDRLLDSGTFDLCNFFGPGSDGRTVEPGQKVGRPFDEIPAQFRTSMRGWLKDEIPARLSFGAVPNNLSINRVFEFE